MNGAGRPKIQHDQAIAEIVLTESQSGTPQEEIATLIGISANTLRKVYKQELRLGLCRAKSDIRRKIYELCMSGNVPMLIFYAKTQLGWTEKQVKAQEPEAPDVEEALRTLQEAYMGESE